MCGVIFGEWSGEDPADKDIPKVKDRSPVNTRTSQSIGYKHNL